jgi:hypothetical protein
MDTPLATRLRDVFPERQHRRIRWISALCLLAAATGLGLLHRTIFYHSPKPPADMMVLANDPRLITARDRYFEENGVLVADRSIQLLYDVSARKYKNHKAYSDLRGIDSTTMKGLVTALLFEPSDSAIGKVYQVDSEAVSMYGDRLQADIPLLGPQQSGELSVLYNPILDQKREDLNAKPPKSGRDFFDSLLANYFTPIPHNVATSIHGGQSDNRSRLRGWLSEAFPASADYRTGDRGARYTAANYLRSFARYRIPQDAFAARFYLLSLSDEHVGYSALPAEAKENELHDLCYYPKWHPVLRHQLDYPVVRDLPERVVVQIQQLRCGDQSSYIEYLTVVELQLSDIVRNQVTERFLGTFTQPARGRWIEFPGFGRLDTLLLTRSPICVRRCGCLRRRTGTPCSYLLHFASVRAGWSLTGAHGLIHVSKVCWRSGRPCRWHGRGRKRVIRPFVFLYWWKGTGHARLSLSIRFSHWQYGLAAGSCFLFLWQD